MRRAPVAHSWDDPRIAEWTGRIARFKAEGASPSAASLAVRRLTADVGTCGLQAVCSRLRVPVPYQMLRVGPLMDALAGWLKEPSP